MNRRLFAQKATGVLAAIGVAAGLNAKADVVEPAEPIEAPGFPSAFDYWPAGKTRCLIGYEVRLNPDATSAGEGRWVVILRYMNRDGDVDSTWTVLKKFDVQELQRKVGTFCSPKDMAKGFGFQ